MVAFSRNWVSPLCNEHWSSCAECIELKMYVKVSSVEFFSSPFTLFFYFNYSRWLFPEMITFKGSQFLSLTVTRAIPIQVLCKWLTSTTNVKYYMIPQVNSRSFLDREPLPLIWMWKISIQRLKFTLFVRIFSLILKSRFILF